MKFEELKVWQKAENLALEVYSYFQNNRDYAFKDQVCRAAVSVMNNIAEGYERDSKKSFIQFLRIAKGSCGEVRSMLHLALKRGYLSELEYQKLFALCIQESSMLQGFVRALIKELREIKTVHSDGVCSSLES